MTARTIPRSPATGEPFRATECRQPIALEATRADRHTGEITTGIVWTRCGSWKCDGCGRRLRALHLALIRQGVEHHADAGRFARLLTLTFPTDTGASAANADDTARTTALVARLVQEIRRTHAPRMEYYAAKEATKRGRLHVHLVTTGPYLRKCRRRRGTPTHGPDGAYLNPCDRPGGCQARLTAWHADPRGRRRPRPCVQAIAHRLGFGWVDVRKVRGAGEAAAYVAKYLAKQVGAEWPRYSRRSTYSRGRLYCDDHPDNNGARCCSAAYRRTYYAPTTIGRLAASWSLAAHVRAIVYHGAPMPDDVPPAIAWRVNLGHSRAPPDPPPLSARTEADALRTQNARMEAWQREAIAAGIIDPLEPRVPAEIARAARYGPTIPHPAG